MDIFRIQELAEQAGFGKHGTVEYCGLDIDCHHQIMNLVALVIKEERGRAIRIVMDDMMAVTYQSVGQYRNGLAYHIRGDD